jgi:ribosomal protein L4
VELLKRLGVSGKAVLVDVALDEHLARSVRNLRGIALIQSRRLTARDVMDAAQVVATRGALEKLQEALAGKPSAESTAGSPSPRSIEHDEVP